MREVARLARAMLTGSFAYMVAVALNAAANDSWKQVSVGPCKLDATLKAPPGCTL